MKKFLLQRFSIENHLNLLEELAALDEAERLVISSAFLTDSGVQIIDTVVREKVPVMLIAGINNNVTTDEALLRAIQMPWDTYMVDTGASSVLFHPKVYFSKSKAKARLIVGSANATQGGLISNVEASIYMELNLANEEDKLFFDVLETSITDLIREHPENVTKLQDEEQVSSLRAEGRLSEKSNQSKSQSKSGPSNSAQTTVPSMQLEPVIAPTDAYTKGKSSTAIKTATPTPLSDGNIVWRSSPLTRRDLNIPTGSATNPTGSMLLKKGKMEDIDQRHYFRDEVFSGIPWVADSRPSSAHIERAEATFQIEINGIFVGQYELSLSHNTKTDTAAYKQKNSMTSLHWGDAKGMVAREELLGSTLEILGQDDGEIFTLRIS